LLTVGASGVETMLETETDASGAAVVVGAEGVSMVVATGVTCAVRSGADSGMGVDSAATPPPAAIAPAWPALSQRRGCGATDVVGVDVTVDQPSSVAGDVVLGADAPVSVGAVVASVAAPVAGGVACVSDAPAIAGIAGIVPMESSYTGTFGSSAFGCGGAGRVVYAFVTTATLWRA
jgi:hypothetical protein